MRTLRPNSRWLAERLTRHIPTAEAKLEIANCGVDLEAFAPRPAADARTELGWDGDGPAFLCVGSLIDRKNVVRLAEAFERLGRGRLAFVGDGPLRGGTCACPFGDGRTSGGANGPPGSTSVPSVSRRRSWKLE